MKILAQTARNRLQFDGVNEACAELIFVVTEKGHTYSIGSGLHSTTNVETMRFVVTHTGIKELIRHLREYEKEMR